MTNRERFDTYVERDIASLLALSNEELVQKWHEGYEFEWYELLSYIKDFHGFGMRINGFNREVFNNAFIEWLDQEEDKKTWKKACRTNSNSTICKLISRDIDDQQRAI